jgi:hypothetical protein
MFRHNRPQNDAQVATAHQGDFSQIASERFAAHSACPIRHGVAKRGTLIHDSSIFRLLVGTAVMAKRGYDFPTWGEGSTAPADVRTAEQDLEREVSDIICAMPFIWLGISDEPSAQSMRGYIERNAIALLSNFGKKPLDPPSTEWLGLYCSRERVRKSGLWNSNHVDEQYDPSFLRILERLVTETAWHDDCCDSVRGTKASGGWLSQDKGR